MNKDKVKIDVIATFRLKEGDKERNDNVYEDQDLFTIEFTKEEMFNERNIVRLILDHILNEYSEHSTWISCEVIKLSLAYNFANEEDRQKYSYLWKESKGKYYFKGSDPSNSFSNLEKTLFKHAIII